MVVNSSGKHLKLVGAWKKKRAANWILANRVSAMVAFLDDGDN